MDRARSDSCAKVIGLTENNYVGSFAGDGGNVDAGGGGDVSAGNAGAAATAGLVAGAAAIGGSGGIDAGAGSAGDGGSGDDPGLYVPPGKLVFERYSTYASGDSKMYVVTFPGGTIGPELTASYASLSVYFTRWRVPAAPHVNFIQRTLLGNLIGTDESCAFCTDPGTGYEDAFSLGEGDLVVFSSNANGMGKGDLFVANFSGTDSKSLNDFAPGVNTALDELGAVYWHAPPVPVPRQLRKFLLRGSVSLFDQPA